MIPSLIVTLLGCASLAVSYKSWTTFRTRTRLALCFFLSACFLHVVRIALGSYIWHYGLQTDGWPQAAGLSISRSATFLAATATLIWSYELYECKKKDIARITIMTLSAIISLITLLIPFLPVPVFNHILLERIILVWIGFLSAYVLYTEEKNTPKRKIASYFLLVTGSILLITGILALAGFAHSWTVLMAASAFFIASIRYCSQDCW